MMWHETGLAKLKKGPGYMRSFKKRTNLVRFIYGLRYELDKLQNRVIVGCVVMGILFYIVFRAYVEPLMICDCKTMSPEKMTSEHKVSEVMESDSSVESLEQIEPIEPINIRNLSHVLPDSADEISEPDHHVSKSKSHSSHDSLRQITRKFSKSRSGPTVGNLQSMIRNFSNIRTDVYDMFGDIRINGSSGTVFMAMSNKKNTTSSITVKPYARKEDGIAMNTIRAWKIIKTPISRMPKCSRNFSVPAVVFSIRGYGGNAFHAFSDLLIPIYMTCRQFSGEVVFLTTDMESWWLEKFKTFLDKVSKYNIIDIDSKNEVMCFPRTIVGLKANKDFSIDPLQPPYYFMLDFTQFLRKAYSLERDYVDDLEDARRPRMLLIARQTSRRILNGGELLDIAQTVGFDVVVAEIGYDVSPVAKLVNSVDVMVGIHGAGLANMIFLPKGAVVIQILPIGTDLFSHYYRIPAVTSNMKYLEYNVTRDESTLADKYPADSIIFENPLEMIYKGFIGFRTIYLENQDVTLNLTKFRDILLRAKQLLAE